jgi:hypothetical protein
VFSYFFINLQLKIQIILVDTSCENHQPGYKNNASTILPVGVRVLQVNPLSASALPLTSKIVWR